MTGRRSKADRAGSRARLLFESSVRDRCSEHNCCLGLQGIADYTVLRGESVVSGGKMCDCVIFHDTVVPRILFVELKSGLFRTGQVVEKFTNALDWLSSVKKDVFGRVDYKVTLLLLHKRRVPRPQYSALRKYPFRQGGRRHSLRVLPCSAQLAALYKKMGPQ